MERLFRGTCDDGFAIESRDKKEAAMILRQHVKSMHKMAITESDAMARITEVSG
jgi:hypothetical protein